MLVVYFALLTLGALLACAGFLEHYAIIGGLYTPYDSPGTMHEVRSRLFWLELAALAAIFVGATGAVSLRFGHK